MAAYLESSQRVNVEFQRAPGRVIRFNHTPDIVPGQLQGRVTPQQWQAFMADVDFLAKGHPYVQRPGAKQCCAWAACFALGAAVGLCVLEPDAGDYNVWEQQVRGIIDKHRAVFDAAGCSLSLVHRRDYWIQIDVDPSRAPAVPVAAGAPLPLKPGMPPPSPFETQLGP